MTLALIVQTDDINKPGFRAALESRGYAVEEIRVGTAYESTADRELLARLATRRYRCVIAQTTGVACELAPQLVFTCGDVPVILISTSPDLRQAVQLIKAGAAEYLPSDCPVGDLIAAVEQCMAVSPDISTLTPPIIGRSPEMLELLDRVRRIGRTDATVLVRGESGTGKELVARALHAASPRAHGPLVSLNCASMPPHLIEHRLFGTLEPDRAATETGLLAEANGGTLFLDEIGELEPAAQARLLRVLLDGDPRTTRSPQHTTLNVRLIASTQRNLERLVADRLFREDLYYRLNVIGLQLPPLRDRGSDILLIADFILQRVRHRLGRPACEFSQEARQAMLRYQWPGNVRELENAIERAVILCDRAMIPADLLAIDTSRPTARDLGPSISDQTSLEDYFVSFVLTNQDQLTETELADKLGISRKSLWERRQRLNIPRKRTQRRAPRREER